MPLRKKIITSLQDRLGMKALGGIGEIGRIGGIGINDLSEYLKCHQHTLFTRLTTLDHPQHEKVKWMMLQKSTTGAIKRNRRTLHTTIRRPEAIVSPHTHHKRVLATSIRREKKYSCTTSVREEFVVTS